MLDAVFSELRGEAAAIYGPDAERRSDFFRDIAGSRYLAIAEEHAKQAGLSYDLLLNVYDKSIIEVENRPPSEDMSGKFLRALEELVK